MVKITPVDSYSVNWEASDVRWASRWDAYLGMGDVQIHWFSIVNSIVVVLFLSGILTMIIIRTLRFAPHLTSVVSVVVLQI